MRNRLVRIVDWIVLRFWDAMRPLARPRQIPSSTGPDWTGTGWGRGFQQAVEDCESMDPVSIELLRSQHATGDQRWIASIWDGDEGEYPTVQIDGKDPADALVKAHRKYRERMLVQGTVVKWRRR